MKQLSYWAHRHTRVAILLIILLEVGKNWIGVHLGHKALPALPGLLIELSVFAVVAGALLIEKRYHQHVLLPGFTKENRYQLRKQSTFLLFLGSFMLSLFLGNRCQQFTNPQPTGFTAQAAAHSTELTTGAASSEFTNRTAESETRPLSRRELREERRWARQQHRQRPTETSQGGYIALFVLGLLLAYGGTVLSCSLSCSNQGFAAIVVGLLAVGALAAGIYFLVRAFRKKPANR